MFFIIKKLYINFLIILKYKFSFNIIMTVVLKFGGSSITKQGFDVIYEQIQKYGNKKVIIVLSVTDIIVFL